MPALSPDQIAEAFKAHLKPDETLEHFAFGVRLPNMLLILPLFAMAIVPGAIATTYLTKNYLVGTTNHRLIVLHIKGMGNTELKEMMAYDLSEFSAHPAKTKTGAIFTHITIDTLEPRFKAKFHRAFSKENRAQAMAIAEAISAK